MIITTMIMINCAELCSQVWRGHMPYPWKGNKHCPQMLNSFVKRLDEVRVSNECSSMTLSFKLT